MSGEVGKGMKDGDVRIGKEADAGDDANLGVEPAEKKKEKKKKRMLDGVKRKEEMGWNVREFCIVYFSESSSSALIENEGCVLSCNTLFLRTQTRRFFLIGHWGDDGTGRSVKDI